MGEPRAAPYAEAVTPETIAEQRALGWPDFHPEDFCHRCGRRNVCWFVDSLLWNEVDDVNGRVSILCPTCFARKWESLYPDQPVIWELRATNLRPPPHP